MKRIAVISVYRLAPSVHAHLALSDLLELSHHVRYFIIAGDFNINLLCDSAITEEYVNLLSDYCLVQHLSESSGETSTSASLIDHVITSKDMPVLRLLQTCGLSDHKVQIATLEVIKFVLLENVTGKRYVTLCSLPLGKLCLFMMTLMINGAIFILCCRNV